ncbi:MAG TPA: hypothetical protein DCR24_04175 [Bacillus bacterium]|nr:hypothetical protein [Bacillus sp. (in: firmicutes)]
MLKHSLCLILLLLGSSSSRHGKQKIQEDKTFSVILKKLSKEGLKTQRARIHDSTNCLWRDLYVKK